MEEYIYICILMEVYKYIYFLYMEYNIYEIIGFKSNQDRWDFPAD